MKTSAALCVAPDSSSRFLSGAEAAVIVVIIVVAAVLAVCGMPHTDVLSLLGATGLLSVALTRLATGTVTEALRHLARLQSAPLPR